MTILIDTTKVLTPRFWPQRNLSLPVPPYSQYMTYRAVLGHETDQSKPAVLLPRSSHPRLDYSLVVPYILPVHSPGRVSSGLHYLRHSALWG